MDTLINMAAVQRVEAAAAMSFAQRVALLRRPLPSHAIEGGNFRKWAAAVCSAEVRHRERDYLRVERELGVDVPRWDFPNNDEVGQFDHERHAGIALLWLSTLQTHESEKRTPWNFLPWTDWKRETRAAWIAKRRKLWAGFIKEVRAYEHARKEAGL
jgi:hypothetical protein